MIKVTISIDVSDLKKAEDFYINALGCEKVRDQGEKMSVLTTENIHLYLQEKKSSSAPFPNSRLFRDFNRHWTPVHLDFISSDIDNIVQKIIENGGKHEGGEKGGWGSIAYCSDPFGNGFCVINE